MSHSDRQHPSDDHERKEKREVAAPKRGWTKPILTEVDYSATQSGPGPFGIDGTLYS